MEGCGVGADDGLRGGELSGGEQEGEDPDGRCGEALHAFGQSMSPDVSRRLRLCADRRKPPVNGGPIEVGDLLVTGWRWLRRLRRSRSWSRRFACRRDPRGFRGGGSWRWPESLRVSCRSRRSW